MPQLGTSHNSGVVARPVGEGDLDEVIDVLCGAFFDDPVWSWAFPDAGKRRDHHAQWWSLFVGSAIPPDWVWRTDDGASVAVWVPPGKLELSEADEARLEPLLRELVGDDHADDVMDLVDLFEVSHPRNEPHFYLSLLATHPECRGRGSGLGLLADALARIDEVGRPAYMEASNLAHVDLYERFGFIPVGEFSVENSPTVTTMWREPQLGIDPEP